MTNSKNVQLATAVNITTTYAGEFAGEYIAAALLSASTIDDGGLTVKANIAFKEVIKKLATGNLVSPASCLGQALPPKFSDFMIAHVASEVAQNTELCIWQGDTAAASNNSFDGFEKLIAAAALAGDIPAGQQVAKVAVTAANVVGELGRVVDAIPATLYGKEDLFIYVPSSIAKFYVQALGGFAANGLGANGVSNMGTQWWNNGSLTVNGVKIFVCPGMSADTMFAAQRSNLYFGTGLLNDTNAVKVLDMQDLDASNNVRMVMRFTSAVQFGIASDLVEYA